MILTAFGILEVRLFWVQIVEGEKHARNAQRLATVDLKVPRGRILDSRERVLAASVPAVDIWAACNELENPHTNIRNEKDETIDILSRLLDTSESEIRAKVDRGLARNPKAWIPIARKVTDQALIQKLYRYKESRLLRGIHLMKWFARCYPQGDLMGHLIGYVDWDGVGACGMEAYADAFLQGADGSRIFRRDGIRNEIFSRDSSLTQGRPGGDLRLTVDAALQLFVEKELETLARKYSPAWSAAVVLEPGTGRVLAAGSVPGMDPRDPAAGGEGHWVNRAFQAEYLPGSSFKPLMMAIAMDAGVVDLGERIDCENGRWRVGRRPVSDIHGGYGLLSPSEILVHSSNIGISKIALRLVPQDARRGSKAFAPVLERLELLGLEKKPSILRPVEEARGRLTDLEKWTRAYSLVSVSFGYELTVTPIQMAAAFMALANGGLYIPPRLVDAYIDAGGNVIEAPQAPSRRVFSTGTAREVTRMLEKVVEEGTGEPARIPGCRVAGKTGTAQKDSDRSKHTGSFIAYAPADDPALLVLVVVDEPKGAIYGSKVAAPAVRAILEKGLVYLGVRTKDLVLAEKGRAGDADR
jgi:cell division protein FtsI (penicillin-binding protein 3)